MSEVNYDECCSVSLQLEFSKFCSKNRRPFIVQKHENKYLGECFSLIQKVKIHHNWNKKKISATVIKSNLDTKLIFLGMVHSSIYRTRAIITHGLYTFYPLEVHLFTVTFGLMYGLYSRAASNQERPMMARVRQLKSVSQEQN